MVNLSFLKKTKIRALNILLLALINLSVPAYADIIYPEYNGENVIDLSQKFDTHYLSTLKGDLNQSDKEIRIVFLNTENKVNLSFYAPKLFEKWNMDDDSILVVIDPYLNKTGYAFGKNVREEMKKRQTAKPQNQNENKQAQNKDLKNVDYDNLVGAIMDKFSPQQIKVKSDKKSKNSVNVDSGVSYKTESDSSKKAAPPSTDDGKTKLIIFSLLGGFLLLGGGYYYYNIRNNNKKQLELKTNYTFDADILQEEMTILVEKIDADIEKMKNFDGTTLEKVIPHIEKLENASAKSKVFLDRLATNLEDLDIDNLGYLRDVLDEGGLLKSEIEELHKESVAFRKEFKSIMQKSDMSMSDIRVNIENCKNLLEEIKTVYGLNMEHSETMILECENLLANSKDILRDHDPAGFKIAIKNIQAIIKGLKKDFDVIPHLYRQIKENIPLNIESALEESLLDSGQRNKVKKEINELKEKALNNLDNGNLEQSEKIIQSIYDRINELRGSTKTS